MKPTVTRGATNNYQAPENWDDEKFGKCGDLQVRRDVFDGDENGLIACVSTWKPSAEDLAHFARGGVLEIALYVVNQPVMSAEVVDPVEPALINYVSHEGTADRAPITINEDAHGDDSHGGPEEDQFGYGGRGASHG
jgi:hypothetical protein